MEEEILRRGRNEEKENCVKKGGIESERRIKGSKIGTIIMHSVFLCCELDIQLSGFVL
jgi:hypothetical protein